MEQEALSVYQLPEGTPKEKQLAEIRVKAIGNWKKSIALITDLDKMKLPEPIHQRNKSLLTYCELRLKSCELVLKAIEEESDGYQDELESYNKKIEATIASMKAD
jgi:rhomboid protease GluP